MALGEILRNAREQKGMTPSAVAESTHMKVQVVEDLEREDFRRIAAPIYGRGFVKLYAEAMQLDPEPLVRDFMELYGGAHMPAIRMKRVESPSEPLHDGVPVTRTVTGTAASQPQRQSVHAKPAVRPLSSPQPVVPPAAEQAVSERATAAPTVAPYEASDVPDKEEQSGEKASPAADEPRSRLVIEPEETCGDSDEPDLFRPQTLRRRLAVAGEMSEPSSGSAEAPKSVRKARAPIFRIGGKADERSAPAACDEDAHARRNARIQAFIKGFRNLKDGVESKLPAALPRRQLLALCGAGVTLLIVMAVGVGVLFKMTGSNVKTTPGTVIGIVAAPPSLYVD